MKKFALLSLLFISSAYADEPVCKKCEVIREYNAAHPENNYYWYDDYLKDQKKDVKSSEKESPKLSFQKSGDLQHSLIACNCGKDKKRRNT